jgi:DNA-binding transcriptional ArsR family regulator
MKPTPDVGRGSRQQGARREGAQQDRSQPPRKDVNVKSSSIDKTLVALADPTRRGVIDLLRRGPRRAGELAEALDMGKPAMTRHLRLLRESGLVREESHEADARVRVYELERERFSALRHWLDAVEAVWSLQLDGFKAHAERTRGKKRARKAS